MVPCTGCDRLDDVSLSIHYQSLPLFQYFHIRAGVGVGSSSAFGIRCLNRGIWNRDIASAIGLVIPGICLNATLNPFLAAVRNRGLIRDIIVGAGDVPEDQTWVIDWLSVRNTIRLPVHEVPHVRAAARMANNSL